jgi:hypothetical protein
LIDGIETGGLIFDRDGRAIKEASDMQQRREAVKKAEIAKIDTECKMEAEVEIKTKPR